jgi:hypothetical protein
VPKGLAMFIARAVLLLLFLWHSPAQAEHDLDVWWDLACETPQQVEGFVDIYQGDPESAVADVNAEAGKVVCVVGSFAFVPGPQVGIVRNGLGTFRIIQVIILGFFTEEGFEASAPRTFFTVGEVDEEILVDTLWR